MYLDEQRSESELAEDEDMETTEDEPEIGFDEALLVKRLLKKNPHLRKIKLVIEWVEKISAQSKHLDLVKQKIGEFQEKCTSWEHTLHHLKI